MSEKTKIYRVAWELENKTYFGNWNDSKELVESWVAWGNRECPEMNHWLDEGL